MRTPRFPHPSRLLSVSTTRRMALTGPAAMAAMGSGRVAAQADSSGSQPGIALPGENTIEFVAAIQQRGPTVQIAGYVTTLGGVPGSLLFDGAHPLQRSETTARVGITGTGVSTARSQIGNLVVVNLAGTVQLVLLNAGATFDDLTSFAAGTTLTTARITFQNVITTHPPVSAITSGSGAMEIESTDPFILDGEPFVIGEPGLRYRLTLTGEVAMEDPAIQETTMFVVGNGVIAR